MSLLAYKVSYLLESNDCQVVIFDVNGQVTDSCETLVHLKQPQGYNVFIDNTFFESIKEAILAMEIGEELMFPRIAFTTGNVAGSNFDYVVRRWQHAEAQANEPLWVWVIRKPYADDFYLTDLLTQQRLATMERELLEIQNKNIALQNELILLKNSELQREKEFKNDFFSKASHELRTPINGIIGLTELLENNAHDSQKQYLKALRQVANQLRTTVNDILDLSKIEAGKLSFTRQSFDLRELSKSLLLTFERDASVKDIVFSCYLADNVPTQLLGDSTRLWQILVNLINNAFKFTQRGEIKLQVVLLRLEKEQAVLQFSVTDTGVGIPPEKLVNVFQPFMQDLNPAFHTTVAGTGLGLAIVKQLVEAQFGHIAVTSTLQQGTTFTFDLPFALPEPSGKTVATPSLHEPEVFFAGKRVLIADDNEINLLVLGKHLQRLGLEVEKATNGQELLDRLTVEHRPFDIIFVDFSMPVMDGPEAIRQIRAQKDAYYSLLPIIAISAYSLENLTREYQVLDFTDFVGKPFEKQDIIMLLQQYLFANTDLQLELNAVNQQIMRYAQSAETDFKSHTLPLLQKCLAEIAHQYPLALLNHDVGLLEGIAGKCRQLTETFGFISLVQLLDLGKSLLAAEQTTETLVAAKQSIAKLRSMVIICLESLRML